MNTKIRIYNLQREIKALLENLGWSTAKLASEYCINTNDYDVEEDEIVRFHEKIKKQLSRPSKNNKIAKALEDYITFIKQRDEYNKIAHSKHATFKELTGFITDYSLLLESEQNSEVKKVLEVAAAHALSIGWAWNFHVVPIDTEPYDSFNKRYIAIWEADIGHYGGSIENGTAFCEVVESHTGSLFVEKMGSYFNSELCFIEEVIGFFDGELELIGYRMDDNDTKYQPSLRYKVHLRKDIEGSWKLSKEELLCSV